MSLNKILNNALEKNLLVETSDSQIPSVYESLIDTTKEYGGKAVDYIKGAAKNPWVQGGSAAAIAAGLGALAIAKKMRKAKEEAKKKAKK